jgi:outer membrane receptor protein involved in Fe transport
VEYNNNQILSKIPTERVANLQITQSFRSGAWLIEPTLGGNGVNRVGLYPIATLGVRHEEGGFGKFLRVGQHRRFPSLLDRYYEAVIPVGPQRLQVLPNADLKPETVRSVELGVDYKNQSHRAQIQGFARSYRDARYTKVTRVNAGLLQYQIVNGGDAWVGGAMTSYDYSPWSLLDVGARATYQRSNLKELSLPFPYSPDWVGILKADLHDRLRRYSLEAVWKGATASKAYSETSTTGAQKVPGYAYMDLFARVRIGEVWTLTGGVENIFDRLIEFRQGVPDGLGRVYSLSGSAVF